MPAPSFPPDPGASVPPKPTVSDKANVIYRALLVKYMRYLFDVEGSAFISDLYRRQAQLTFTPLEWHTLEALCKEADK